MRQSFCRLRHGDQAVVWCRSLVRAAISIARARARRGCGQGGSRCDMRRRELAGPICTLKLCLGFTGAVDDVGWVNFPTQARGDDEMACGFGLVLRSSLRFWVGSAFESCVAVRGMADSLPLLLRLMLCWGRHPNVHITSFLGNAPFCLARSVTVPKCGIFARPQSTREWEVWWEGMPVRPEIVTSSKTQSSHAVAQLFKVWSVTSFLTTVMSQS
jgi:hypothetical protein